MNLEVVRGDTIGFCMGVRRAIQKAYEMLEQEKGKKYSLGPLIHNRLVMEDLKKKGILLSDNPEDISNASVLIRAHGVPKEILEVLDKNDIKIIDATCPRVLRSQKIVKNYSEKDYQIVLAGDREHGEVKSIASYAENVLVVEDENELTAANISEKVLLIAQTTIKMDEFKRIADRILEINPKTIIENSICPATEKRQKSLKKLITQVDALIIIGGKNSANTKRLYLTAENSGKPSWHIEDSSEIPKEICKFRKIGISAGSSTPDNIIDKIEEKLQNTRYCS